MKHLSDHEKRLGFRIHGMAFVATMLLLVAINLWTGRPYWVVWVAPGWTAGLLCHWYFVLGPGVRKEHA